MGLVNQAMDPLKKLSDNNKKYEKYRKKERLEMIGHFPIFLASVFVYFSVYIFLVTDIFDPETFQLTEMSKQVWFVAMILSAGIGAIFFIGSLSLLIWLHLFASLFNAKVSTIKVFIQSAVLLSISLMFFLFGKKLDWAIHKNALEITRFMRFGFEETPVLIEMVLNFVILVIALVIMQIALFVISIPFNAKKHAAEAIESGRISSP